MDLNGILDLVCDIVEILLAAAALWFTYKLHKGSCFPLEPAMTNTWIDMIIVRSPSRWSDRSSVAIISPKTTNKSPQVDWPTSIDIHHGDALDARLGSWLIFMILDACEVGVEYESCSRIALDSQEPGITESVL